MLSPSIIIVTSRAPKGYPCRLCEWLRLYSRGLKFSCCSSPEALQLSQLGAPGTSDLLKSGVKTVWNCTLRTGSSVSCLPNCTLLAGFRVLLVSAFASYLAWILIFLGIWCPKFLIVTGFIIVTPPPNINSLGKLATQSPGKSGPGNIFIVTGFITMTATLQFSALGLRV